MLDNLNTGVERRPIHDLHANVLTAVIRFDDVRRAAKLGARILRVVDILERIHESCGVREGLLVEVMVSLTKPVEIVGNTRQKRRENARLAEDGKLKGSNSIGQVGAERISVASIAETEEALREPNEG